MTTVTINRKELNKVVEFSTLLNITTFQVADSSSVYNGVIGMKVGSYEAMYFTTEGIEIAVTEGSRQVIVVDLDISITVK